MTYVITEPQLIGSVAADIEGIGSAISAANAAAASPISAMLPAAGDEVSELIANLFAAYGQEYRAVLTQATVFQSQFSQALVAAASAYAAAEAANATAVSRALSGGSGATGVVTAAPADPHYNVAIVMGGSGNPIPNTTFVNGVLKWAAGNFSWTTAQAIFTPEGLYPLTGVKSLPLDTSVNQGVQILDATIKQQLAIPGNSVLVQGYSQSSIIASLEMRNLLNPALNPTPPTGTQLGFNLLGDPMNPNGGLLERFAGLSIPSLGVNFYGATPSNTPWPTNIYSLEYDGFADFPRYPIDFLSDLNAVAGIAFVHPLYPHLDPSTRTIVQLPVSSDYTGPMANTTYYMALTPNLPLLDPLRYIPVVGNPLADLLQPDLKYLVNWGYGDPLYGYSTSPANVPTPFGLFPAPGATTSLPPLLVSGAQQGVVAAGSDIAAEVPSMPGALPSGLSLSGISQTLSSISLPSPATLLSPASIDSFIHSLQAANTNVTNAFSRAASAAYSVLLPTADVLNAAVTTIPSYDANLFLNGIAQAAGGDPVGLLNAVGDPIAATTGLVTVAGGVEALVVVFGAAGAIGAFTGLVP
jgi:PE-PPE domain/PE family